LIRTLETMINVDPLELEKFSQLAHRWWDPGAEFKPLHEINPLRLDYIDGIAGLRGKRIVDVGCGGGILAEAMAARGARVTGIDLAENRSRWPSCTCWSRVWRWTIASWPRKPWR